MRCLAILGLLVACLGPPSAADAAPPLGRLFFTPEQRAAFERQRHEGREDGRVRLDGVALRSGKKLATWADHRVYRDAAPDELAGLRVGESLDPVTGQKTDVLPHGAIRLSGSR